MFKMSHFEVVNEKCIFHMFIDWLAGFIILVNLECYFQNLFLNAKILSKNKMTSIYKIHINYITVEIIFIFAIS